MVEKIHFACPGNCGSVSEDATALCPLDECTHYGEVLKPCECTDAEHELAGMHPMPTE